MPCCVYLCGPVQPNAPYTLWNTRKTYSQYPADFSEYLQGLSFLAIIVGFAVPIYLGTRFLFSWLPVSQGERLGRALRGKDRVDLRTTSLSAGALKAPACRSGARTPICVQCHSSWPVLRSGDRAGRAPFHRGLVPITSLGRWDAVRAAPVSRGRPFIAGTPLRGPRGG